MVRDNAVVPRGCVLGPDTAVGKGVRLPEFTRYISSHTSFKGLCKSLYGFLMGGVMLKWPLCYHAEA